MGRRKKNEDSNLNQGICKGTTLREENIGKKEVDVSSILKIKHLQKLATWAGGEGGIPSLGALFGYQLAANAEASGVPLDKSSFFCQRCESILQPGFNCRIRIETCKKKCKKKKRKRSKKASTSFQNNIIYNCNFCHHRNSIKGTTKGQVKNLISLRESRLDSSSGSKLQCSLNEAATEEVQRNDREPISQLNCFSNSTTNDSIVGDFSDQKTIGTPLQKSAILGGSNSAGLSGSSKGSGRKKRRKIWSSLKDIVERKEAESTQNGSNFAFPLFMQEK